MAIISGTIGAGLPEKFSGNKLDAELEALAPGIGWKLLLDEKNVIGAYYEFDESIGVKRGEVEAVFKNHRLEANEDDDFTAFEKQQAEAEVNRTTVEDRLSAIESRLQALEKR